MQACKKQAASFFGTTSGRRTTEPRAVLPRGLLLRIKETQINICARKKSAKVQIHRTMHQNVACSGDATRKASQRTHFFPR